MLCLSGCKNDSSSETSVEIDINTSAFQDEHKLVCIYDINNKIIGEISCYQYSTLVKNNILYTKLLDGSTSSSDGVEYWLYNIDTKTDTYLGTVKDYIYEASYETTLVDDHVYMSVTTGSYTERTERTQYIYDIDLAEYTMTPIIEMEGGIPYNSFTITDNKLIMTELLENGDTDLIEYDLATKHEDLPIVHKYNESDVFVHDSIRHITTDEEYIYMMRLDWNKDDDYFLYLDYYDHDLNLLKSLNVNDIFIPSDYTMDNDSIVNERKQWISQLEVHDSYIYYENFSATRFLGTIEEQKVDCLMNTDITFYMVNEVESCHESDLFFVLFGDQNDKNKRNQFYLADSITGEIYQSEFYADDERYMFTAASRNKDDMILLTMGNVRYTDEDKKLPDRLYYININDLNFSPLKQNNN